MREHPSGPSVVVGIDGSRSALDAALWAVDEAAGRDIPLRLVCALSPDCCPGAGAEERARCRADAHEAVRYALSVVEATGKAVKIETEMVHGRPTRALVEASRSAVLLCVGSVGLRHGRDDPVGSTAAALATAACCPVAVVRGHDPDVASAGWVVAEIDDSDVTDVVVRDALDEARLRGAVLRVVTTWQCGFTDIYDSHAGPDRNKLAKARLDRRLAKWRRSYPDVDVQAVAVHGNTLAYLTKNANSIQLVVVGREHADTVRELVGPPGYAAVNHANCSVLICEPQNVL